MDQNPSEDIIRPNGQNLQITIEHIECTLVILNNLLTNYENHTPLDRWEVMVFLLRQISDIQFQLLMAT